MSWPSLSASKLFTSICIVSLLLTLTSIALAKEFKVPWGTDPGQLTSAIGTEVASRFKGPASFCLGRGQDVYILDSLECAIEWFDENGTHLAKYDLPVIDENNQKLIYADIACSQSGTLYVLEARHGAIMKVQPNKRLPTPIIIPGLASFHLLTRLAVMADENLLVYEALSGTVIYLSQQGELHGAIKNSALKELVLDQQGNLLGTERPEPKKMILVAIEPRSGKRKVLKTFRLKSTNVSLSVLGEDGARAVYLERTKETKEGKEQKELIVWRKEKGTEVGKELPFTLADIKMSRTRRISRTGQVIVVSCLEDGLTVKRFD